MEFFRSCFFSFCLLLCFSSCRISKPVTKDDGVIKLSFIQINDVYEIAPLEGGKSGGLARVAMVKNLQQAQVPNTFAVMAGDFLSPSIYNTLKLDGTRIRGQQMIEALNAAGLDFAVFGNHEFDITESELQQRINESTFQWISSNTFHLSSGTSHPFIKYSTQTSEAIPEYHFLHITDSDGSSARIGLIGITLPFNKANYVTYSDPNLTAKKIFNKIKDSCDFVIAITHQSMEDDIRLAEMIPELGLIMGGHEHDMRKRLIGNVWITKAHANAKSAFIIDIELNINKKSASVVPNLVFINDLTEEDPKTDSIVSKWNKIASDNFSTLGFDAQKIIWNSGDSLDGRESVIRASSTNLSRLVVRAMEEAAPLSQAVLVNAGSIRVDDILTMPVTQYDILRTLPFGGSIVEVDMKGSVLKQLLSTSLANRGIGGFLHYSERLKFVKDNWFLNDLPIIDSSVYRIALTDFLLTGGEANMEFLTPKNPGITRVYPVSAEISDRRSDIRLAIIRYMEKHRN